jgi:hypothetical protein
VRLLAPPIPWQAPQATGSAIEAYASQVSIAPGGRVALHVSTRPAARYLVELYRLGWYGGAGARRTGCAAGCVGERRGRPRAHPRATAGHVLRAGWPVSDVLRVGRSARSGYYLVRLRLTSGPQRGRSTLVPLVVRPPPNARPRLVVVLPVNTWQAYNWWGGKSAYAFNSTGHEPALAVSFDRPYAYVGLRFLPAFAFEYQTVRFLERSGIDAGYTTDVDVDRDPAALRRARLVIDAGHDEYWSRRTRDAFEAARDAGVNLVFLGADIGDWQIRYADRRRTVVAYHDTSTPDPAAGTPDWATSFPRLGRPACTLLGEEFQKLAPLSERHPLAVTAAGAADPWAAGTGLAAGDVLPGLVSYEWAAVVPGCATPPLTVLFHYEGPTQNADTVRYTSPSGATVLSVGTLPFAWALDDYGHRGLARPALQRFMRHALHALAGP